LLEAAANAPSKPGDLGAGDVHAPASAGIGSGSPYAVVTNLLHGIADPVRLGLVRCLVERREATAAELSRRCQASGQTIRRHLEALVISGIVTEAAGASDGATLGRPAARFSLQPEARMSLSRLFGPHRSDR
jgi:DNA-binding transcriptional ArsR family regulator